MLRDGAGRGMLRSFALGQFMPTPPNIEESVVGQFGNGPAELAKAESMANQEMSPMGKVAGALGGNPSYSGWNFGALAKDMMPTQQPDQQPQQQNPWGDLMGILSRKYNGGF